MELPTPKLYQGVEDIDNFINRVFTFMSELEAKHNNSARMH